MSRPRKPIAQHILNGNPSRLSKAQLAGHDLGAAPGTPETPKGLSEGAQREWNWMVKHLSKMGLLTKVDKAALRDYCDAYAEVEEQQKLINKYGRLLEDHCRDPYGDIHMKLTMNPAVAAKAKFMAITQKFLTEFGMSPLSRSRIHLEKPVAESPMAALLNKKRSQAPPSAIPIFIPDPPPAESPAPDIETEPKG